MSQRKSGILLHPTSLPGEYGIGDLGRGAYRFVDYLAESGQRLWQILPLGPPGYGNSPYQCFSSIAGNPLLISPEGLADQNLLSGSDLERMPDFPSSFVDFGAVIPFKQKILRAAAKAFFKKGRPIRILVVHRTVKSLSAVHQYALEFAMIKYTCK